MMMNKISEKITRNKLYEKFPYLKNLSASDMIYMAFECFKLDTDHDLQYSIKRYLISYPELQEKENLVKIYP